jgi:hypothetical protein
MLYYVKLYQTISKISTMCTLPPQKWGHPTPLMYANSHTTQVPMWPLAKKYPLPSNTTPATFSRVPCVIWELFRRMVYMYVPLFYKISNCLCAIRRKNGNFAVWQTMKKKFENGRTNLRILPSILGFWKSFLLVKSLSFPSEKFPNIYCVLYWSGFLSS